MQVMTYEVLKNVYPLRCSNKWIRRSCVTIDIISQLWTDWKSWQCSVAVLVVRFVSHRTNRVHKATFVNLEILWTLKSLLF